MPQKVNIFAFFLQRKKIKKKRTVYKRQTELQKSL